MLSCACDDMKVHIYVEQEIEDKQSFKSVITLPGHEDWVRAVEFTVDGKTLFIFPLYMH